MVAVTVAQDQPVDLRRLDVEELEVAVDDLRRVAEVEHVLGFRAVFHRCEVEREPPFAGERHVRTAGNAPDVLDAHEGVRGPGKKALVARIDHDADRQLIDDGRFESHGTS